MAFRYVAPTVWNSTPFDIRHLPSIGFFFKRHLKTYFFTLPGWSCSPPSDSSASDSILEIGAI